jgi:hypothetical protein
MMVAVVMMMMVNRVMRRMMRLMTRSHRKTAHAYKYRKCQKESFHVVGF